jgi:hypothetical protein
MRRTTNNEKAGEASSITSREVKLTLGEEGGFSDGSPEVIYAPSVNKMKAGVRTAYVLRAILQQLRNETFLGVLTDFVLAVEKFEVHAGALCRRGS